MAKEFKFWGKKEGYHSEYLDQIIQDKFGFIWLGTNTGVYRFDGNRFTTLITENDTIQRILNSEILALYEESKTRMWIGGSKGICYLDYGSHQFHTVKFPDNRHYYTISVVEDEDGKIWLSTNYGIFVQQDKNKPDFKPLLNQNNTIYSLGRLLKIPNKPYMAIATIESVTTFQTKTFQLMHQWQLKGVHKDNILTDANIDHSGKAWLGIYNGDIVIIDPLKGHCRTLDIRRTLNNPNAIINHIYKRHDKIYLVADESGILVYNDKLQHFEDLITRNTFPKSLPSFKITKMLFDEDGNLWFGMKNSGIGILNNYGLQFGTINNIIGSPSQTISSILQDQEGKLWVGTDGGGLYVYEKGNTKDTPVHYGTPNDAILALHQDIEGNIWVGSFRNGLGKVNHTNKSIDYVLDKSKGLVKNDVRRIKEDKHHRLWLAIHGYGLTRYTPKTGLVQNYEFSANPWTFDVIIDSKENVWASTSNGLSYILKNNSEIFNIGTDNNNQKLIDNKVFCLHEFQGHEIWLGTTHGIYAYDAQKSLFYRPIDHPAINKCEVKSIIEDSKGNLYIATNQGLFRYIPHNKSLGQLPQPFGLSSEAFIANSVFKNQQGQIYFGTDQGLCWLDEDKIFQSPSIRAPYIQGFYVFNKKILPSDAIELAYDQNQIHFEYSSPTYMLGNTKVIYEYRLEGIDQSWNYTQRNESNIYSNLPPGSYTIQIRALDGNNTSPTTNVKFVIRPPFWNTWWFYMLSMSILFGSIYLYILIKTKTIHNRNKTLEDRVAQRTNEISIQKQKLEVYSDELAQANEAKDKLLSIIAHDLKGPISQVNVMTDMLINNFDKQKEDVKKTFLKHIQSAGKGSALILENLLNWALTHKGAYSFHPKWTPIDRIFRKLEGQLRYDLNQKNIKILTHWSGPIDLFVDEEMFITIMRNLLGNAIKYSFANSKIEISICQGAQKDTILIKDYGMGIDEARLDKINKMTFDTPSYGTNGEKGTGIGLIICSEFIKQHGFDWIINSTLGQGTEVMISLPPKHVKAGEEPIEDIDLHETDIGPVEEEFENIIDPNLKGKSILIVDDDESVRLSLRITLEKSFKVFEAMHGLQALEILGNHKVDLIVTDLMMPEMDGILLIEKIKANADTAHMPILVLTSQNEDIQQLKTISLGADEYLTKPFNGAILQAKIYSIVKNRDLLQKKFLLDDKQALESIAENSTEKKFIKKLLEIIEANLSDSEFGVEELSKEIGMHRTNLSKKVSSVLNISPQDLLKSQRLKRAAMMLLKSGQNISEIAYDCGFSDPKYFRKSFKAHFGMLPTEYKSKYSSTEEPPLS